jgi:hypothetical protein
VATVRRAGLSSRQELSDGLLEIVVPLTAERADLLAG